MNNFDNNLLEIATAAEKLIEFCKDETNDLWMRQKGLLSILHLEKVMDSGRIFANIESEKRGEINKRMDCIRDEITMIITGMGGRSTVEPLIQNEVENFKTRFLF